MERYILKEKTQAFVCLFLAMGIVGSSVVFGKVITVQFPLFLASELRFFIASLLIVPVFFRKENQWRRISKRDWRILIGMAFCGQFVFTICMLIGLRYTSGVTAGALTSTTPLFMTLVTCGILKEKLRAGQAAGIFMASLGILLLNSEALLSYDRGTGEQEFIGNIWICLAVMGEAIFLLLAKKLDAPLPGLYITGLLSVLGAMMFFPLAAYEAVDFSWGAVSWQDWLCLFYFGAVYTVLAYVLWFRGLAAVSGGTASSFTAVMPLSAAALSLVFLQENCSWLQAAALVLIIFAILFLAKVEADAIEKNPERSACHES